MFTRLAIVGLAGLAVMNPVFADDAAKPIRVLIVTGGHDFDRAEFFAAFDSMKGIAWKEVQHPAANDSYTKEAAAAYDVVVLYDMVQEITEEQKQNFIRVLKEDGKGLVALHHCLASYQAWPEYTSIIGGKYFLADVVENGKVVRPGSTYDHDQDLNVQILDPADPITKGVSNFVTHDEAYNGFDVSKDVKPLLRVEHPKCGPIVGWSHEYGKARVAYIMLGHDKKGYDNQGFKALVHNAILWAAKKDGEAKP
ncbi:MAG: ThuA domain-containing protein [Candidatus Hydrogenedentes bacterium]|nr:ThuA domain-containing protein [Candidatus Hydrogenedentota bacterium]